MDALAVLFSLGKAVRVGRSVQSFSRGGPMVEVMSQLADVEGRAAARAIADSAESEVAAHQLIAAETLLRSSYEKSRTIADKKGLAASEKAGIRGVQKASLTALALAHLCCLQGNRVQSRVWIERARKDFDEYISRAHSMATHIIRNGGGGIPGILVSVAVGVPVATVRNRRMDKVVAAFESTYAQVDAGAR